MKTFRKFALLADLDNANIDAEELKTIVEKVEALGNIVYIKLYGCNDKRLKEFSELVAGKCCDTAPVMRSKQKSRKSLLDTRVIVDAIKLSESGVCDSFAIIAGEGDFGYMLAALKQNGKFIAGRFDSDINIAFCDVYLGEFDSL